MPAYRTLDATIGWRWDRCDLAPSGTNLGDRRPPVSASKFGDQAC